MGYYFGWVGMGGALFLGGGDEWGWVHYLIMPFVLISFVHMHGAVVVPQFVGEGEGGGEGGV